MRLLKVLKNNLQRLRRQIVWSMGLEVRYLCILSAILPAVQSWANYYLGSLSARLPICKMRIITSHWIVGLNELMHVKCLVHCKYLIYFSYYDSEKNTGNFTFMSLITFVLNLYFLFIACWINELSEFKTYTMKSYFHLSRNYLFPALTMSTSLHNT